jgi:pimeloyl-ACP methyl ester carboxylesterase
MRIQANGIAIEVDDAGSPNDPAVLLIMGLGMQLTAWPQPLVDDLVRRGRRVVRLDNRDAGLTQSFEAHGTPNVVWAALRHALGLPINAPYRIADMAADAVGVLDALGIDQAHVVGASMGGMIAQHIAAKHAARVSRLTLLMTTPGARHLPQASPKVRAALLDRRGASAKDIEVIIERYVRLFGLIGSPAFPPDPALLRERLRASIERAHQPTGVVRQLVAVAADGDRSALVRGILAPTHIIHGKADPLIPLAAGQALHQLIPGATLDEIEGMGHDLPRELWPRFAEAFSRV